MPQNRVKYEKAVFLNKERMDATINHLAKTTVYLSRKKEKLDSCCFKGPNLEIKIL